MSQDSGGGGQDSGGQPTTEQQLRQMLAALAVGSLLAAAAIYLLREMFGIPDDTARMVALVFALVAVVDGLVDLPVGSDLQALPVKHHRILTEACGLPSRSISA